MQLKEVEPRLVAPIGQCIGRRERTSIGFYKIVPITKNSPEVSPSSPRPTKKSIYKAECSIVNKKKSRNVEVASAPKYSSSAKNRSSTEKDKGKNFEPEVG